MSAAKIAHLFVDASNINVYPREIRALHAIARENFTRFYSAIVVGSTAGPSNKPEIWKKLGYMVKFSERYARPEKDFNVDDTIVATMLNDILEVNNPEGIPCVRRTAAASAAAASLTSRADHVMVLLSGDGNDNGGWPSLFGAIEKVHCRPAIILLATQCALQALLKGWEVKLISLPSNLNRVYHDLQALNPSKLHIRTVTEHEITEMAADPLLCCSPVRVEKERVSARDAAAACRKLEAYLKSLLPKTESKNLQESIPVATKDDEGNTLTPIGKLAKDDDFLSAPTAKEKKMKKTGEKLEPHNSGITGAFAMIKVALPLTKSDVPTCLAQVELARAVFEARAEARVEREDKEDRVEEMNDPSECGPVKRILKIASCVVAVLTLVLTFGKHSFLRSSVVGGHVHKVVEVEDVFVALVTVCLILSLGTHQRLVGIFGCSQDFVTCRDPACALIKHSITQQ
jgi:hypothetical protein